MIRSTEGDSNFSRNGRELVAIPRRKQRPETKVY